MLIRDQLKNQNGARCLPLCLFLFLFASAGTARSSPYFSASGLADSFRSPEPFVAPALAGTTRSSPSFPAFGLSDNARDSDSLQYKSLDPHYFHLQYLKEDTAWLIDVSMFYEFRKKRLRDAINIPSVKELYSFTDTISKNTALFLYCTDGFRSEQAAGLLNARGISNLYNLEGGIIVWKKEGFPVEKGRIRKKKTRLFR